MIVHFFLFFLKKSARQAGVRFFSSRMIGFLDENKKKKFHNFFLEIRFFHNIKLLVFYYT